MAFYSFSPTIKTEKEVLQKDGVTLAVVNVALPSLSERDDPFAKSLNGLYTRISEGFLNYCRGPFCRKAEKSSESKDFVPYGAVIKTVPAFENSYLFSCYFDVRMTNGTVSSIARLSQTFDKSNGNLLRLEKLFKRRTKPELMKLLAEDAKNRGERGVASIFSDYERRLRKFFNSRSFYLSPTGFVFYYGEGELGTSKGICPLSVNLEDCSELLTDQGKEWLINAED